MERSERSSALASYDPSCYLCPGNARAEGARNPQYASTFVFDNDFAALQADAGNLTVADSSKKLLMAQAESGICRVVYGGIRNVGVAAAGYDAGGGGEIAGSMTEGRTSR